MRTLGVVTTSFPQHDDDMAGRFVLTLLRSQHAHEAVDVLAIGRHSESLRHQGLRVTRIASRGLFDADGAPEVWDRSRGRQRAQVVAEAMRVTAALTRSVGTHARSWDAVQSHWLVPSALAVALAAPALFHTAYVHSGDVAWLEAAPGGARLARWLLARVNEVVCVSPGLAARVRALVGADVGLNLKVQAMPVDEALFRPETHCGSIPAHTVLGVGRLVPIKGFDLLVLALGGLAPKVRPSLVLLGEGPERARLAALAHRVGVRLQLPGVVSPAIVRGWMQQAAVCVVPSRTLPSGRAEGAPLVLREAMAMGVPLIATGVHSEQLSHSTILPATANVVSLRTALSKILRS